MHMLSTKDLNSAELESVRVNGEVQTNEEATVCVSKMWICS